MKITILLLLFSVSCANIRMKYEAKYEAENDQTGTYVYKNSYEVGGFRTLCWITGIVYGGACWLYLGLPSTNHKKQLRKDASAKIKELLGTKVVLLKEEKINRLSWDDGHVEHHLMANNQSVTPATTKNRPKKQSSDQSEEFLR